MSDDFNVEAIHKEIVALPVHEKLRLAAELYLRGNKDTAIRIAEMATLEARYGRPNDGKAKL